MSLEGGAPFAGARAAGAQPPVGREADGRGPAASSPCAPGDVGAQPGGTSRDWVS